jgi:aminopeptidase N
VPSTASYRYFPATGGSITYNKTALWLNTMERWLGWPTMQRLLAAYFERWKFRHPSPDDFFAVASEVSGQDLTPFFDQVYRTANGFDYGVEHLTSVRDGDQYRTQVIVRRYGEAVFPIDVAVTFGNSERMVEHWDGVDRWKLYTFDRPVQALSAAIDPDRVLLLDLNYTNNSRTLQPRGDAAATKWSLKWMVWLQDCLLSWAALA